MGKRIRKSLVFGMVLSLVAVVFAVVPMNASAEPEEPTKDWVAIYNDPGNDVDAGYAIAVDPSSGNVYVTGYSYNSVTNYDYFTIAYDSDGNELWNATYDGPGNGYDSASDIAIDSSGNIYITGHVLATNNPDFDFATVAYDSNGNELWNATYNGPGNGRDRAFALAVDSSSNVYVTGYVYVSGSGSSYNTNYATIAYDSDGIELWNETYDGPGTGAYWDRDHGVDITIDLSGHVYVTGGSGGSVTNMDFTTIAYDAVSGNELWVTRHDEPATVDSYDTAYAIATDSSGNVYVTGYIYDSVSSYDYYTIAYNSSGAELWNAIYNGPGNDDDLAYAIALDSYGNIYVSGNSDGNDTYQDIATVAYNSSGTELWVARYNGSENGDEYFQGLAVDSFGYVYVTGESWGGDPNQGGTGNDYATVAYNSSGDELWVGRFNGPGNDDDSALAIAADNSGNVYVTGISYGEGDDWEIATIKYPPLPNIIYVDDDAYPGWYDATHVKTIQEGINNASAGYTVFVYDGTYYESITMKEGVTIQGSGAEVTMINATGLGKAAVNGADNSTITEFTITGSQWPYSGIKCDNSSPTITNNIISDNGEYGIHCIDQSSPTIANNIISNNGGDGIKCDLGSSPTITNNVICYNSRGILCKIGSDPIISYNNIYGNTQGIEVTDETSPTIINNNIHDNDDHGIEIWDASPTISDNYIINNWGGIWGLSSSSTITNNVITNNDDIGIYLIWYSDNNTITGNYVSLHNQYGIYLSRSSNNEIKDNLFLNNGKGIYLKQSSNNQIYHNNLINNTQNGYDDSNNGNQWDNGYPSGGNFWSGWTTPDNNNDGIVDNPFLISGGSNQDNYPLATMNMWPRVHNINKDLWYTTIQTAIDHAAPGDTIEVKNGTFYENVVVDKTVTLHGEDKDTTIIDGGGSGNVFKVTADSVIINGFTVTGSGSKPNAGIMIVNSNDCQITNNNISSNNGYGIDLISSSNNEITNNIVSNNDVGISLNTTITQITDNAYTDDNPQINDAAQMTWYGHDGSDYEIFFWDGSSITQITDNTCTDYHPDINSNGHVVWEREDNNGYDIFYWNGTNITQITDQDYEEDCEYPQINEAGHVTWQGYDGNDYEIFFWNGSNITQITNDSRDDEAPEINDDGYVTWNGYNNSKEIFLWNGTSINQITDNAYSEYNPQINNNGDLTWSGYDGTDSEIFFWNGTSIIQITNDINWYESDGGSKINDAGQLTWYTQGQISYQSEIIFWNGSNITQITNDNKQDGSPQINNAGHVTWMGYDGTDYQIFFWDGENTIQITDNVHHYAYSPKINNAGYITWYGGDGNDMEIFIWGPTKGNIISNNNILNNDNGGVDIQGYSNNNLVYHNNFLNDTNNAFDEANNTWDNGYPSGGNYWSNYTGIDNFKGPNQDQPGSDGIGDTPYVIDSDSQDRYPLMEPWNRVHNLDSDLWYYHIQDAVDDAEPGNSLWVSGTTYYENVIVDKPITLTGDSPKPVIDAMGGTGITVNNATDHGVTVDGFNVTNSTYGIYIDNEDIDWLYDTSVILGDIIVINNELGSSRDGIYVKVRTIGYRMYGNSSVVMGDLQVNDNTINSGRYGIDIYDIANIGCWMYDNSSFTMGNIEFNRNVINSDKDGIVGEFYNVGSRNYDNSTFNMGNIEFNGNMINSHKEAIYIEYFEGFGEYLHHDSSFTMGNITFNDNVIDSQNSNGAIYIDYFNYFGYGLYDDSSFTRGNLEINNNTILSDDIGIYLYEVMDYGSYIYGNAIYTMGDFLVNNNNITSSSEGIYLDDISSWCFGLFGNAISTMGNIECRFNTINTTHIGIVLDEIGNFGSYLGDNASVTMGDILVTDNTITNSRYYGIDVNSLVWIGSKMDDSASMTMGDILATNNTITSEGCGLRFWVIRIGTGMDENASFTMGDFKVNDNQITSGDDGIRFHEYQQLHLGYNMHDNSSFTMDDMEFKNNLIDSGGDGIRIKHEGFGDNRYDSSTFTMGDLLITNDRIASGDAGIYLHAVENATISDCVLDNCSYGIYADPAAKNNIIYHNNFLNNTIQALDTNPPNNDWYHPVILEGNYWSDYTGLDNGSGTGKHAIAGDGIGDTNLPHLNLDNYPLMYLYGYTPIGSNVSVYLGSGIIITFSEITEEGSTTVEVIEGVLPPSGFTTVPFNPSTFYEITSSAAYNGTITISIMYNESQILPPLTEDFVKLWHNESGTWTDVTTSLDTVNNTVQGSVDHLSLFAIMIMTQQSPRSLKTGAISELEAVKTGVPKIDKKLDKAIKHIEKSLDDKFWLDDLHLDSKHSKKVFDEEKKAVKDLQKLIKAKNVTNSVKDACQAAIDKLIEADKLLAQIAYKDAQAYAGNPKVDKELEKCEKELTKAQKELDHTKKDGTSNPKYAKAIDHYKLAWEHAQKAVKYGTK